MAFNSKPLDAEPRSFSIGPLKVEIQAISAELGDEDGTLEAKRLHRVDAALVLGLQLSDEPEIEGTKVTLEFADPGAEAHGHVILLGRC